MSAPTLTDNPIDRLEAAVARITELTTELQAAAVEVDDSYVLLARKHLAPASFRFNQQAAEILEMHLDAVTTNAHQRAIVQDAMKLAMRCTLRTLLATTGE